jgi:signal transduction histidine kinase/ActR/RegA family two-component response regulator
MGHSDSAPDAEACLAWRALAEREADHRRVLDALDEGVGVMELVLDEDGEAIDMRFVDVNPSFAHHTGLRDAVGKTALELVPDLARSWIRMFDEVARTGEPRRIEHHEVAADQFCDVRVFPVGGADGRRVVAVFTDISDRKRRERHAAFLSELHVALTRLVERDAVLSAVGERIRGHLRASRVVLAEIDEEADRATIVYDLHGSDTESALGPHRLSEYVSPDMGRELRRGQTMAVDDVKASSLTAERLEVLDTLGIAAMILAPHVQAGRLTFVLAVYQREPRPWRSDEIDLLRELSASVWFRLERARADEAIRESERRKDQFLAVLSHELRNPLAPIHSGLSVLDRAEAGSELAARARAIIKRQVAQLTRLVDDLLDVTRVSRGKIELELERLDLGELVRSTAEDHRPLFEEKGIHFSVSAPDTPVWVRGDRKRITQALGNLLHNAWKFTPASASASVSLAQEPTTQRAVMRVVDTGFGIPAPTLASIFEPFSQVDASLARSTGGLGLGLTLVKAIAQMHGGEATAHSEGADLGAEFELRLPLVGGIEPEATPTRADKPAASRRVLIVEDAEDVAESLRAMLELEGHEVKVARTGPEGLALARSFRPSIVLCDIGLPGMSGYEVAREMRADPSLASIYRIALTGYAMPEDVRRCEQAGFDQHVAKPLDLEALRELFAADADASARGLVPWNRT